jgi:hypothetical protein
MPTKFPGILAALPKSLPFYPYYDDCSGRNRRHQQTHRRRGKKHGPGDNQDDDIEAGIQQESKNEVDSISDTPIYQTSADIRDGDTFTLFFFIDCTNRQSLLAVSVVSKWFQYSLNGRNKGDSDSEYNQSDNRVICVPNHPTQSHNASMLLNSGFYELPFHHSSRFTLIHLLNVSRVPSIIVVKNNTGRIISSLGWEAIEREGRDGGILDQAIERNALGSKKNCNDCKDHGTSIDSSIFDSQVVNEWKKGRSGLPCWWYLCSCVL